MYFTNIIKNPETIKEAIIRIIAVLTVQEKEEILEKLIKQLTPKEYQRSNLA